jgi:hypothetical protein
MKRSLISDACVLIQRKSEPRKRRLVMIDYAPVAEADDYEVLC